MAIASINPATGETLQTFVSLGQEQLDARIQLAHTVFQSYRRTSFAERAGMMLGAAEILEAEKKDFARTMTLEMGKPIKGAVQEAEKCA
ncbi:MAG TPA: aldehyde dehydrogenase family protein, partial [Pyrinomonadaceae bacterium]|nr:aldehyde dehydrogenase family protein [Pyrinomonadaceae bacterium]